jgi:hypothetical protein
MNRMTDSKSMLSEVSEMKNNSPVNDAKRIAKVIREMLRDPEIVDMLEVFRVDPVSSHNKSA